MKHGLPNGMDSVTKGQESERDKAAHLMATVCGLVAVCHAFDWAKVDQWTIVLIAMAFLPWLGFFVSKVGPDGVHPTNPPSGMAEREGLRKAKSLSEDSTQQIVPLTQVSPGSRKVFKTLVHYQIDQFGISANQRWVFTIPFGEPSYPQFMSGIVELVKLGLVSLDEASGMFGLTDEGVRFYEQNQQEIDKWVGRFSFEPRKK